MTEAIARITDGNVSDLQMAHPDAGGSDTATISVQGAWAALQ